MNLIYYAYDALVIYSCNAFLDTKGSSADLNSCWYLYDVIISLFQYQL